MAVIKSYKILSTDPYNATVDLEIVVVDEGGKLGPDFSVSWDLMCGGSGVAGSTWMKQFTRKDLKTFIIRPTLSEQGGRASGTCEFGFSVTNNAGYESVEQRTSLKF